MYQMALQHYELTNLNYKEDTNKKNYVIAVDDPTTRSFEIPRAMGNIVKFYAGEDIRYICQAAANEAEGLFKKPVINNIIDQINAMDGVGPASAETLLKID